VKNKPTPARAAPQEVRIIGGQWRRSKLPVLDKPGLRPTPDRVRETLFNWLGQDLSGWRVLDAFAGTGALGMEAASRGAVQVLMLERDAQAARQLEANCKRLQAASVQIRTTDALVTLAAQPGDKFDLIFLDPPFEADVFAKALSLSRAWLAEGGWVYLEANRAFDAAELVASGWELVRQLKAGAVHAHLLRAA